MSLKIEMVLGGYFIDDAGIRHQLTPSLNPERQEVINMVHKIAETKKAVLTAQFKETPNEGSYKLDVYIDSGTFLPLLNVFDEDGDHYVRTSTNEHAANDWVIMLGEKYPASATTGDIDFVCDVLNEFICSGDVVSKQFD